MEKVLVTGGAGFIGSHLVNRLLNEGYHVTVVDDLSRGRRENIPTNGNVTLYQYSLTSMNSLLGCDIVFHLAAKVSNIEYNRYHNYHMMQYNLELNTHMSYLVALCKPTRYFYVSTACVYPHDAPIPTPEYAANICNPEPTNRGYGIAKWVGEQQAKYLHRELHIPTTVVRFFNAFGVNDYYDESSHVAPALIRKTMEDDEIVVWGTGKQTRVLVDARDIAEAMVRLLRCEDHGAMNGQPVNIGHSRETSIADLAYLIRTISGMNHKPIVFDTSKPDGYPRRAADVSRLHDLIGWTPHIPLEETIAAMLYDYRRQKEAGWVTDG